MQAAEASATDTKAIKKSVCASLFVENEIKKPHGDANKASTRQQSVSTTAWSKVWDLMAESFDSAPPVSINPFDSDRHFVTSEGAPRTCTICSSPWEHESGSWSSLTSSLVSERIWRLCFRIKKSFIWKKKKENTCSGMHRLPTGTAVSVNAALRPGW